MRSVTSEVRSVASEARSVASEARSPPLEMRPLSPEVGASTNEVRWALNEFRAVTPEVRPRDHVIREPKIGIRPVPTIGVHRREQGLPGSARVSPIVFSIEYALKCVLILAQRR